MRIPRSCGRRVSLAPAQPADVDHRIAARHREDAQPACSGELLDAGAPHAAVTGGQSGGPRRGSRSGSGSPLATGYAAILRRRAALRFADLREVSTPALRASWRLCPRARPRGCPRAPRPRRSGARTPPPASGGGESASCVPGTRTRLPSRSPIRRPPIGRGRSSGASRYRAAPSGAAGEQQEDRRVERSQDGHEPPRARPRHRPAERQPGERRGCRYRRGHGGLLGPEGGR